jgi:hypothetical protein
VYHLLVMMAKSQGDNAMWQRPSNRLVAVSSFTATNDGIPVGVGCGKSGVVIKGE